jgi:hypothetical protein
MQVVGRQRFDGHTELGRKVRALAWADVREQVGRLCMRARCTEDGERTGERGD